MIDVGGRRAVRSASSPVRAPNAGAFAAWPFGWHVLAESRALTRDPQGFDLYGGRLVGYRRAEGAAVVLDARCWHLGADLSQGSVADDQIRCPFHGWCFGRDGACTRIPAQVHIPPAARVASFVTVERAGLVFVYPSAVADHPPPFFDDARPEELVSAPPFSFTINCPWWLVGTNGFDLQHFAGTHDRRLVGEAVVETPGPGARRITCEFEVCGGSLHDRLTRRLAGPRVTLEATVHAGSLAFVRAMFHSPGERPDRVASYGLVDIRPLTDGDGGPRTRVTVRIFVRRRRGVLGVAVAAVDARIRSHFVRRFLEPDTRLLDGVRYDPNRLIDADRVLIEYLDWLADASRPALTSRRPEDIR